MSDTAAFYYDEQAAEEAVAFFPEVLVHVKGELAGQPLELDKWQADRIIRPLFGWKRKADGTRRYRTVWVEIPRKNGKSTLGAGLALMLLCADGEEGAEVYSCASDRDQAKIVFDVAKQMVRRSPELRKRVRPFQTALVYYALAASYKVLSSDSETKHGFNAHAFVFDEVHAQPNRKLYDVMSTSTGARRQPIEIYLTTAGWDRNSVCYELHDYAEKVAAGIIQDDEFLAVIYAAAPEDPWDDPTTWAKANPGLGTSVKLSYLESKAKKAKTSLAFLNTFRRLHLNQWTEQAEKAIDMALWDACAGPAALEALAGRPCFAGLDLASSRDIAALVLDFPDAEAGHLWIPRFWIPRANIEEPKLKRDPRIRERIAEWVAAGLIIATPGDVIDYAHIRKEINALNETVEIKEIAFDRWGATQLSTELADDGFTMVPFGQGFASMAAPTKELLTILPQHRLAHGGHPVLRWMASNFSVKIDAAENMKPDKATSSEKIDGIVAGLMALDRACRHAETPAPLITVMGA